MKLKSKQQTLTHTYELRLNHKKIRKKKDKRNK